MITQPAVSEAVSLGTILDRTQQALLVQGWVPESPGVTVDGRPILCAGAMLVREALAARRSLAEAERFAAEVVDRDRDFICRAGADVGLDRAMVRARIIENDSFAASERLDGVVMRLRRVAAPQQI